MPLSKGTPFNDTTTERYPSTVLHPSSVLRRPSAVKQHRRITKLRDMQTASGEKATIYSRPDSMRHVMRLKRAPSAEGGGWITADVDCFEEKITMRQSHHVPRPLELPSIFPATNYGGTVLFKNTEEKRFVPRSVVLSHIGENVKNASPVCWEQKKREERLDVDCHDTLLLEDTKHADGDPMVNGLAGTSDGIDREMATATQNRQHQLWKLQMALQLIKRASLYKLFVRYCDYRTRVQLVVREADFIIKALDNDMSPLQPTPVLGYHPLVWILSIENINFSYKDLSSHYVEVSEEAEQSEEEFDDDNLDLTHDSTPRSVMLHYLRTAGDQAIFNMLTEMALPEEKSAVASLLDFMFYVMVKPPMKPLDMTEFRQVMVNFSTELRKQISYMQSILNRLKLRVEKKKSALSKEWLQTRAEFCSPHGDQAQLEGYHVPTEYEIGILLDGYIGELEEPTTTFTGVELTIEEVEVWFRFIKDFHVTGVSILKIEHILESVAIVMSEVSAPLDLPDSAYEIFGYNGILSKHVDIDEVNIAGCPALKATRLPGDDVRPGDAGVISDVKGSARAKEGNKDHTDLAHSLFALDVLGHNPLRVHHDLDFALEEIIQLVELARRICVERRSEDQRYREATCVNEVKNATAALHAAWAKETEGLLEYMRRAELRVANVHFIHNLLRDHAPQMYKAFQEEHRTYLNGRPPSKKLQSFTELVERYNPFPNLRANAYLYSEVQKKYPKNFYIMAVCHESYAQLKECEDIVFWIMIKHYTAAVKAHRMKMRHNNRIPPTQPAHSKTPLLIDHERIEGLTTPGYHLNEKANPLLLPNAPKAIQVLSWLEKLVGFSLRSHSVGGQSTMSATGQRSTQHSRSTSIAKLKEKRLAESVQHGVMDYFIVTDYYRQLYEAPE